MDFRILGPLEVRIGGEVVRLGGRRQQKLMAMLLIHANEVVTLDRLVDGLWDEAVPQTAQAQLHNAVWALRRALTSAGGDGDSIVTEPAGYRLVLPEGCLDLHRFWAETQAAEKAEADGRPAEAAAALLAATGLWRGPAVAGLRASRAIDTAAAGLDEQYLVAVERLGALRLGLGQAEDLVSQLIGLVGEHPFREPLRALLMLTLAALGRQTEALTVYEEGRRLLADELGLDPGEHLREAHAQVLRGTVPGPPPPALSRPRHLPAGPSDFVGRSADIDQVVANVRRDPAGPLVITAIDGMGGVGKTALAVHLAELLAGSYPDGLYFIDLQGFSVGKQPQTPEAALDVLLRQAGMPVELIPPGLTERAERWRSMAAGKRILVVLDNAADAAQVRPLLPGTTDGVVLVTSRRRLTTLDGGRPVSLDVLSSAEAVVLFQRIAERATDDSAAVADVVELCGRLPLAIRIAASRLRHRPAWTVADLAERLRETRRRMHTLTVDDLSVYATLQLSYTSLPDLHRRTFRLLGIHPGQDIDRYAVAALTGLPVDEAEEQLESLCDCNLLMQPAAGRYQLHDLIRDCAKQLAQTDESESGRREAAARLFDYYLYLAHEYCDPMTGRISRFEPDIPSGPVAVPAARDEVGAIGLLETEYQNLMAVATQARESGWPVHSWQLPCVLRPFLERRNFRVAWLHLFEGAFAAARRLDDQRGQSTALANIAVIHRELGRLAKAIDLLKQALVISQAAGDQAGEARQTSDLGITYLRIARYREARECFRIALELAERLGSERDVGVLINNLGFVAADLGEYPDALEQFERALVINRDTGSRQGEVLSLANIGRLHGRFHRYQQARSYLTQALVLSREVAYRFGEGWALAWLAAVHRREGDLTSAIRLGRLALDVGKAAGVADVECAALNCLGETYLTLGDVEMAADLHQRAEALATSRDFTLEIARAVEGQAHVALRRGELAKARGLWERALALYPERLADEAHARSHLVAEDARCERCAVG
ncbi:BTAD domain-containing putative transcriptional regulator [Actinocrispum sp. NPDC049592]|uniref:AfsR/SARP family transcriptional regulator n=1 Tax=Actinocrispum sp. NPDC049592 TaxID=3154835 RepID=UPI0034295D1D